MVEILVGLVDSVAGVSFDERVEFKIIGLEDSLTGLDLRCETSVVIIQII